MKDTFEITSGHLVFSDPCYTPPSITVQCLNGRYTAWVEKSKEDRIKELSFCSVNYSVEEFLSMPVEVVVDLYVDSGQVGVFDKKFYHNDAVITEADKGSDEGVCKDEPFYNACTTHTLSDRSFGCLTKGAVSSSGYGDGCYEGLLYLDKKIDKIVGGRVVFIEDCSCICGCDKCCEHK